MTEQLRKRSPGQAGFTLVELLAIVAVLALLAATLPFGMARTRPNSMGTQCLNNLRQVSVAWTLYATDHSDVVANNFGVIETSTTIGAGQFGNWANNLLTWGASTSVADVSNTNVAWLAKGGLGKYLGSQLGALSCPADDYVSAAQRSAGWTGRTRSISMNSVFGRFNSSAAGDPTASGRNWAFQEYRQYLKQAQVPRPFKTWLFIEEHPDSINDGYFISNPMASNWQDIPAAFHHGGTSLAFGDLHCETKKWLSPTSRLSQVKYQYYTVNFDALGRQDYAWHLERTGWVNFSTGLPQFGY